MARITLSFRTGREPSLTLRPRHPSCSPLLAVALLALVPAASALAATLSLSSLLQAETPPAQPAPATTAPGAQKPSPAPASAPGPAADKGKVAPPSNAPAAEAAASPVTPADRSAAYQQFKDHFAARRFAEALPFAEQLVTLTEQQSGVDSEELIKPLLNLGTTQMRMGNLYAAETVYRRALRIAESRDGGYSRTVIEPLHGLGLTYQASGRYANAAESLKRAVDVSRKLDGLFNIEQLPLVEGLVESYVALDKRSEVDREQQYAMRLSENTYGRDDPRMLPVLARSADWCESTGRYRMARQAHARSLEILGRTAGKRDPGVVAPLRGIARSYKLEFLYGSSELTELGNKDFNPSLAGIGAGPTLTETKPTRLDPDGESALKLALSVVLERPDLTGVKGEILLDLGDWYMLSSRTSEALRIYKESWLALTAPAGPGPALMNEPSQLYYRAPTGGNKREDKDPDELKQSYVEVEFKVSPDGRVSDVENCIHGRNRGSGKVCAHCRAPRPLPPTLRRGQPG